MTKNQVEKFKFKDVEIKLSKPFLGKEILKGYVRDVWSSKIRLWVFESGKHQFTTYIPFDEILEIKEVNNE